MGRFLLVAFCLVWGQSIAQTNFRSRQTGNWNQSTTWEEFIAGSWQLTGNTPSSASGTITIRSPHVVTVTAGVSIDQTTIDLGATLVVNDAIVLDVANGTGTDIFINGSLTMLGESVMSGLGSMSTSGTINIGSLDPTGGFAAGNFTGNVRLVGRSYTAGANIVYNGLAAQFIGDGTPTTVGTNTIINNPAGVSLNNTFSTLISMFGDLIIQSGNLNVQNDNLTVNSATSTIFLIGGDLVVTSASAARTLTARNITLAGGNVTITSGSQTTACNINGALTINSGTFSINSSSFTSTLTANGAINLTGGVLAINSGPSDAVLNVMGDITGTSFITFSGANANLNVAGSGAFSRNFPISGPTTIENIFMNRTGITLVLPASVVVTGVTRITSGNIDAEAAMTVLGNVDVNNGSTLFFEGQQLEMRAAFNTISGHTGVLSSNATSTLRINGAGSLGTLRFSPSGNTVGTVILNRAAAGTLVTLNSALTVNTLLQLTDGGFQNVSGLNMATGATIEVNGNASFTGAVPTGSLYNLTYTGPAQSTRTEAQGSIQDVTVSQTASTLIIATSLLVNGTLTLNTGNLSNASSLLTMGPGSTIARVGHTGSYSAGPVPGGGPYNVVLTGTTFNMGGEVQGLVNDLTINTSGEVGLAASIVVGGQLLVSTGTLTAGSRTIVASSVNNLSTFNLPTTTLTVSGNLSNSGIINAGTGTVIFSSNTTLGGTTINSTNFNNITLTGSLTPSAILNVLGNFTNNGSFVPGTGTVIFSGSVGSKTLSGSSNTQFTNLTLNKSNVGTSLTVLSPQTVTGSLVLTAGTLNIASSNLSMQSGSNLTRSSAAVLAGSSPSGGPWNLTFIGGSLSTTYEVPSGNLLSLTVSSNSGATVALASDAMIINDLTINAQAIGPTFTSGAHNVSMRSLINGGVFNNSTSPYTTALTGDISNFGSFNGTTGTTAFNGSNSVIAGNPITVCNLTINGTLNKPSSISITGNFVNNGTFAGGNVGTVQFIGSVIQNISGSSVTAFNNINVTNTASIGARIQSNQDLHGTLTLGPNVTFDADGSSNTSIFTLVSTDDEPTTQDARIAAIPATSSVTGRVTVQRFMDVADNVDRFISSPVTNAPVSQLQDDFSITGEFTGTSFPCTGCENNGENLWFYVESVQGHISNGYMEWPTTTNTQVLTPGVGYDVYMWNGVSALTLDLSGPINQGTIPFTITQTDSSPPNADDDGWNLLGNPYPSSIVWNTSNWPQSQMWTTVYVWDASGFYRTWDSNSLSGNLLNGVIATCQAFWVYALAPTATLSITEAAKTSLAGGFHREKSRTLPGITMKLSHDGKAAADESYLLYREDATREFDRGMDAPKLIGANEKMAIASLDQNGRKIAYNYLKRESLDAPLPLYVKGIDAGIYSIELSLTDHDDNSFLYLVDAYLGKSVKMSTGKPYMFQVPEGGSIYTDRFFIVSESQLESLTERLISLYPNPAVDVLNIRVHSPHVSALYMLDSFGRCIQSFDLSLRAAGEKDVSVDVHSLATGVYLIKAVSSGRIVAEKFIRP